MGCERQRQVCSASERWIERAHNNRHTQAFEEEEDDDDDDDMYVCMYVCIMYVCIYVTKGKKKTCTFFLGHMCVCVCVCV